MLTNFNVCFCLRFVNVSDEWVQNGTSKTVALGKFLARSRNLGAVSVMGLEVSFSGGFYVSENIIFYFFGTFRFVAFFVSVWSSGVEFFRVHGYSLSKWAQ